MNSTMHENAKPILFSTPMVQQLPPRGIKTQTRRVIKPQPSGSECFGICTDSTNKADVGKIGFGNGFEITDYAKPRYQPGDILWVRETWYAVPSGPEAYVYRADSTQPDSFRGWKPSIFMPREAARIFLRVKRVWAERVQDISNEDAIAEGIDWFSKDGKLKKYAPADSEGDGPVWPWQECPRTPIGAYQKLWDEINAKRDDGKYAWAMNPWVWCYEFERVEG